MDSSHLVIFDLQSSILHSSSTCGCMIVNSYQPNTLLTLDPLFPAMSGFLWNPNITPISYEVGDWLYGLTHCGQLLRDEEDAEGEIMEDTVEEEVI